MSLRILIADDEAPIRETLSVLLQARGYEVYTAKDGQEALGLCRTLGPDLIISDVGMPVLNGFGLLEGLRQDTRTEAIPFIFLSGWSDRETVRAGMNRGAEDYLTKPFTAAEVYAAVETRLNRQKILETRFREHLEAVQRSADQEKSRASSAPLSPLKRLQTLSQLLEEGAYTLRRQDLQTMGQLIRLDGEAQEGLMMESLEVLGRAAAFRDTETGRHTLRVAHYARILGQGAGLAAEDIDHLFYAAPLHDVGKIGIPDGILMKPGPLDLEESQVMRTHTTIGHQILKGGRSPYLQVGAEIALTHHERWDGQGYPQQLRGPEIPLCGRLTAVADMFDALTTARPYKPAWDWERAVKTVLEGGGTQFDPDVTALFSAHQPEFREVWETQKDDPVPLEPDRLL